jgi:hypothetical protein
MVKSTVVDNETGKSIDSTVRTSTGTFFGREVGPFFTKAETLYLGVSGGLGWVGAHLHRRLRA